MKKFMSLGKSYIDPEHIVMIEPDSWLVPSSDHLSAHEVSGAVVYLTVGPPIMLADHDPLIVMERIERELRDGR